MSEKTKKLLENLKKIAEKKPETKLVGYDNVFSNLGNDRIYSCVGGTVELINKNNSIYKGKISKRAIIEKGLNGNNFRSHVYETADGRWFDRAGMFIKKPNNLVGDHDDTSEEGPTI